MIRYFLSSLLCLLLAAPVFAATDLDAFKGLKGTLDIAGGTAHIPVMKDAAKNIMQANADIRITVAGGGSGVGVQKAGEGLAQIGNTGRALKQGEIEKYGLETFPFAVDGVAVAVHPANSVGTLTKAQLKDIFSGTVTNWKAVGGADAPINVFIREDGSGTRETFEERAVDKAPASPRANVVSSNGGMKTAVARDKSAIGYVGLGHLDESVKGVAVDGKAPTQTAAADGTYPITRLLYMNTKGKPEGLTLAFINYIYSPSGMEITRKAGYIPAGKK